MSYPPTPPTDPYRPAGEEPEGTGQQGPVPPAYPGYPQQSPSPYGAPAPGTPDGGYPQYGAPAQQPPYGAPQQPPYGAAQQPYGAPGQAPYGATPYGATPVPGGAYGYFPRNDLGIWAFVLGIASIVLSCGFFTGIPAIIVGSKAKRAVAAGEANNGGLALAGVILGWVGIALSVIGVIFLIAIVASPEFQAGFQEGYYG
ncbi:MULTISPECIES: DUF4190 domain-containing protein [Oerskovia]|uniref:DUF4190 domain-containing protein n=1 Tax=Oerskovia merdavium TaxID=2762227 RepID=A0ABR8U2D8_9CELL|nr:DUF4190 domain-containing protein [Oerskovia merdavium]MBD7981853.1 DUF4190 domain-containing protein [Oerskovia merdavium]